MFNQIKMIKENARKNHYNLETHTCLVIVVIIYR